MSHTGKFVPISPFFAHKPRHTESSSFFASSDTVKFFFIGTETWMGIGSMGYPPVNWKWNNLRTSKLLTVLYTLLPALVTALHTLLVALIVPEGS